MAKGFMDGYKTYDTSYGFGNTKKWRNAFHERMTGDEAAKIIGEQADTPHTILGVALSASKAEIKTAFRKLVMLWHPDRNQHRIEEAEAMTKKLIAAYTILSN